MSASPTRYHASKPSSRPTSPQTPAEVRSQAVAKLKRAASLPRQRDGRRPNLPELQHAAASAASAQDVQGAQATPILPSIEAGPSAPDISPSYGAEEVLSPSPVAPGFDHTSLYRTMGTSMSRTASGSSSFHIPTPPHMVSSSPYYVSTSPSPTPDWAMHLSHSYIPSLSPIGLGPIGPILSQGRNTPSPLPSLGDLRDLQRSNSAAARAKAMSKLTGGHNTPSDEDHVIQSAQIQIAQIRPTLQRADSLGAPRALAVHAAPLTPDPAALDPKPSLQRSFTVSSSNMGEERRSAVGRRMVERLAERRAARQQEELEVRALWQQRRSVGVDESASGQDDENDDEEEAEEERIIPVVNRSSPPDPPRRAFTPPQDVDMLNPDRPTSRNTTRSNAEPFEYDAHLRRSLSSRTARGAVGTAPEILPRLEEPTPFHPASLPLDPPRPLFVTPTRHAPHASTSTEDTVKGQSPGAESSMSSDALQSMMFVVGPEPSASGAPHQGSFPLGVEENGASEWGTPAHSGHQSSLDVSPQLRQNGHENDHLTPPGVSTRSSVMSWEEVGGLNDREVPSDVHYQIKSGSISAKLGRNWSAIRKKSHSRSSVASSITSPPTSPKGFAISSFSRRASESSLSPSQLPKGTHGEHIKHQPSLTSLSPSMPVEASANSILLQHQLAAEATAPSLIPRADPNDPRIHSSKLSPFPGIAHLEHGQPPKLIQQTSDSAVPSQQRVQPTPVDSTYSLPLPTSLESRRASDDSVSKRSWLAKALGQQVSPRSSGSIMSRKSSNPDDSRKTSEEGFESDPFAAPPPPSAKPRHRSGSPTVSVVPEVSEEGSRFTRFTNATRLDTASPLVEEQEEKLPPKSVEILKRIDNLLALSTSDPARPEILDDPPRKLLLSTQVLQVVNANTAKDRFLFLFNDILVVTKPLFTTSVIATLDNKFLVKSVVSLDKLGMLDTGEPDTTPEPRPPYFSSFIGQFALDPVAACKHLVERRETKIDHSLLASLIFRTPELDKIMLGALLSSNEKLMRSFIDRFNFVGIRIDEALRMFLLAVRLPTDPMGSETLLTGFAHRYVHANAHRITFDRNLATELVFSIMHLNDSLYGMYGFALLNSAVTPQVFISAFRSKDPRKLVPEGLLAEVYASVRATPILQALEGQKLQRQVAVTTMKASTTLTYDTWSDWIDISLPAPDDNFGVRLLGHGLEFDPPLLDFSRTKEQKFRVRGKSLGAKMILFDRIGHNAALYGGLGSGRAVVVERAFMKHTFQVAFVSHLGLKRKYCFSVNDAQTRGKWTQALSRQIFLARTATSAPMPPPSDTRGFIRRAAAAVSLQVLRDALIPPPESAYDPRDRDRDRDTSKHRHARSGSVSKAYPLHMGKGEEALGPLHASRPVLTSTKEEGLVDIENGKKLVLVCRQNSLLPGLLELLQSGVEEATGGTSLKISTTATAMATAMTPTPTGGMVSPMSAMMSSTSTTMPTPTGTTMPRSASRAGAATPVSSLGRMASMRGGRV